MDQVAVAGVHPAVGGAVDPDHLVDPLHAQSRMGDHQSSDFQVHRRRRTQLAERSHDRVGDGDPGPHLEIAALLDADPDRRAASRFRRSSTRLRRSTGRPSWQKFKFITWPSMQTLYLTSSILSMIWTLGDFNSVYLLTGGGPADLTHVLATLGIRYLRLDQVDLSMAAIVCALPLVLAAGLLHDETAVQVKAFTLKNVTAEAKLLLIGIPVLLWTMLPIYHLFLFSISPKESAFAGKLWPDHPTLHNFEVVFGQKHYYLSHFWLQLWNSLLIAVTIGVLTLLVATGAAFAISRLKVKGGQHGHEPCALHLFHPGGVPRRSDVQDDGQLRPAQQPVGADPCHGHDRLAVFDLGAQAGVRQAALRARRSGAHRWRIAAAAFPAGLSAADDAVARRHRHVRAAAGVERVPVCVPAACRTTGRSRCRSRWATSWPPTIRRGSS